jgi:hypothetical protein
MKLQYLGDSKDSFKWDYHDFLVSELGYPLLNIAPMMTPDDGGNDGKSHPALFPARNEILDFCQELRQTRSIESIKRLPTKSGASYRVCFHKGSIHINNSNRFEYFSGFNRIDNQVAFLDPDNGFEPDKSYNEKHVQYKDIARILEQLPSESIISVFQHFRRISFPNDFARIRERLESGYSTAIHWHSLMFVAVSKSVKTMNRIILLNEKYADINPVQVIA